MRRINLKFLLVLTLALFSVIGTGVAVWYFNSDRASDAYLKRAQEHEAEGNLRAAIGPYQQYLAFHPEDQETKGHVALLAAAIAQLDDANFIEKRRAYRQLTRFLRNHPERDDLRRSLVDVLIARGSFAEVKKQIDELQSRDFDEDELDYIYALSNGVLGEYEEAIQNVSELVGFDENQDPQFDHRRAMAPEMLKAYLLFAKIHRERNKGQDDERRADAAIEQMIAHNPNSAEAFLIRGRYLLETNTAGSPGSESERLSRAVESLGKSLELDPNDEEALLENAALARRKRDYPQALEYLERAQKIAPDNEQIYIDQNLTCRQMDDSETGIACLQKGLEVLSDNKKLLRELFNANLMAGQTGDARVVLESIRGTDVALEFIELFESQLLASEGQFSLAIERLNDLRPRMLVISQPTVTEIDGYLANFYQRLRQYDNQHSVSMRLLGESPRSSVGWQSKAAALMRMERYDEALEAFDNLRRQVGSDVFFGSPANRDAYMELLIELGRQNPRHLVQLERIRLGIYESAGIKAVDKALVEARSLYNADRQQDALDRLEACLVEYPTNEELQEFYLHTRARVMGPEDTLAYLEQVMQRENSPWQVRPSLISAKMDLVAGVESVNLITKMKSLESEIAKFEKREQADLWLRMARAYFTRVQMANKHVLNQVDRCLRNASELNPNNREVAELQFETGLLRRSEKSLVEALEHTEKMFGRESDLWKYQRARYLIFNRESIDAAGPKSGELDWIGEVEDLIEEIDSIRPNWHELYALKGLIARFKNDSDLAIENYQQAINSGPMDLRVAKQLTELLISEGRISETRDVMNRIAVVPPNMVKTQALLYALSGDKEKAIETASKLDSDQVANIDLLIWRSRLLAFLGEKSEAEATLLRAVDLEANHLQATRALVDFSSQNNSPEATYQYLRNAENRLSETPEMLGLMSNLHHGFYLSPFSIPPFINEHYLLRALAADPENIEIHRNILVFYKSQKRFGSAVAHLNGILGSHVSEEDRKNSLADWARRELAMMMGDSPGIASLREAMGLIEANRTGEVLSEDDTRAKGFILAKRREPYFRLAGIRLLETVPPRSLEKEEARMLAELYFLSNRFPECKVLMERLTAKYPEDVDLLSRYCEMLFAENEKVQARRWLNKLNKIAPDSLAVQKIRAIDAKMEGERALKMFEKSSLESLTTGGRKPSGLKRVQTGEVLEIAGLYDAAETQYREAVAQDQQLGLALASFLSRQGKLSEFIDVCRDLASEENIRILCGLAYNTVVSHPQEISAENMQQIGEWFAMAKRKSPKDISLRMLESLLLDQSGKTEEAIAQIDAINLNELTELDRGLIANNRAYLNLRLGNHDRDVFEDIEIAIEKIGPTIELLDTRAMAAIENDKFEDAVRDLNLATQFKPDTGRYHFHLALAYQGSENRSAAKTAMETAKSIGFTQSVMEPSEKSKYEKLQRWLEN